MAVLACEEDELPPVVAGVPDGGECRVAGYDERGEVGGGAAWVGAAAGVGIGEAEGVGELLAGDSFDDGKGRGNFVDVELFCEKKASQRGSSLDRAAGRPRGLVLIWASTYVGVQDRQNQLTDHADGVGRRVKLM